MFMQNFLAFGLIIVQINRRGKHHSSDKYSAKIQGKYLFFHSRRMGIFPLSREDEGCLSKLKNMQKKYRKSGRKIGGYLRQAGGNGERWLGAGFYADKAFSFVFLYFVVRWGQKYEKGERRMNVTYLHHSGFAVETEGAVLLFDYYTENGRKAYFDPAAYGAKPIYIFVSHAHEDHFDRRILDWAARFPNITYILSADIRTMADFAGRVYRMQAQESLELDGLYVETLQSNDEGVAFLVKLEGKTIYHAGDLNWWHWNGEPDIFNEDIRRSYTMEIDRLQGEEIDLAFVPADLRLEDKYFWAVDYFMQTIGAKALFPMHFWGKFEVCDMLREKAYGVSILRITQENQTFTI